VKRWHAQRDAAEQSKRATKTSNRILSCIGKAGEPQTPSAIAAALEIPQERAKKAMQRMAHEGKLRRTVDGYEIVTAGTF
jgi:DNA-binding IclR family transcriptional regulator